MIQLTLKQRFDDIVVSDHCSAAQGTARTLEMWGAAVPLNVWHSTTTTGGGTTTEKDNTVSHTQGTAESAGFMYDSAFGVGAYGTQITTGGGLDERKNVGRTLAVWIIVVVAVGIPRFVNAWLFSSVGHCRQRGHWGTADWKGKNCR